LFVCKYKQSIRHGISANTFYSNFFPGSSKKPSILGLEKSKEMIAAKSDEQLLNKTTDGR